MKQVLIYILSFLFISFQLNAQWKWEYPIPQGNNLNAMDFFPMGMNNIGLAVGNKGALLIKNNPLVEDSARWLIMDSITNINFFDLSLRDSSRALLVGEHGTIFSMNPDLTWSKMESNTFYTLNATTWVTDDKAFAVGADGLIMKYENDLWAPVYSGIHTSLNSIFFSSDSVGISAGFGGVIMRTSDGGDTWTQYIPDSSLVFNDIHFPSENIGYVVGNGGIIIKTEDAGLTWNKISPDTIVFNYNSVRFFNDTMGYFAGDNGQMFYTRNGGKILIKNPPKIDMRINAVYHENINTALGTVIACGENGIILESELWGEWENISHGSFNNINKIKFFHDTLGIAFGGFPYGNTHHFLRYHRIYDTIITTSDTTINNYMGWEQDTSFDTVINHYIIKADFPEGELNGYLCGKNGGLYKMYYIDSIVQILPSVSETFFDIETFPNANLAFAVGTNATIVRIVTGQNIAVLNTGLLEENLFGVDMADYEHGGFVVGDHGTLLRIRNNGNNIIELDSEIFSALYDVTILNDSVSFAVGAYGIILKFGFINDIFYRDVINSGVSTPLVDVNFINDTTGYIVGDNGMILRTTDGGNEWLKLYSPTNNHLKTILFTDDSTAYIGGYGSTILKTVNGGGGYMPVPFVNENKEILAEFSLYPNPVSNEFTIKIDLKDRSDVVVNLYDLSGRMIANILNEKKPAGIQTIDYQVGDLQKGIYLLSIRVKNQQLTKKLVILQ